jgi:hypothetical protein
MSKERNYLSLNEDGSLEHVYESRSPRNLSEDLIARISNKVTRCTPKVFKLDDLACGLITTEGETFAYRFIKELKLNTLFRVGEDKLLRPVFLPMSDQQAKAEKYPRFVASWKVPKDMNLMFAAKIFDIQSANPNTRSNHSCFLIAWCLDNKAYRLPLPNLYDNCDVCTGDFDGSGRCIQSAFAQACTQMEKATWNSDLLDNSRSSGSDTMFRFKPVGEAMESVELEADWKPMCPKVATAVTEILMSALP